MAIQLIKKWSFNRKLNQRRLRNRDTVFDTVSKSYKIGIFYTSHNLEDDKAIHALKEKLSGFNYYVRTLAYVDRGGQGLSGYVRSYNRSKVSWDEIPLESYVDEFISTRFDLLICPIVQLEAHHRYIISLTNAEIKAGIDSGRKNDLFDLMIDVNSEIDTVQAIDLLYRQIQLILH